MENSSALPDSWEVSCVCILSWELASGRIVLEIKKLLFWLSHSNDSLMAQKERFLVHSHCADIFQLLLDELPLFPTLR